MRTPVDEPLDRAERARKQAELTTFINTCRRLEDLLPGIQAQLAPLFEAQRSTLYAVDAQTGELYSLAKSGSELKEIRLPRTTTSIAGFVAVSKTPLNLRDVYDPAELARVHPRLRFDDRWDRATGFRTQSMMAIPVVQTGNLVGLIQIINQKRGEPFSVRDQAAAEEIARLLAVAISSLNQKQSVRQTRKATRWDRLVETGVITAEALSQALGAAQAVGVDSTRYLIETVGLSRDAVEESLCLFYRCDAYRFSGSEQIPDDLRAFLRVDFLKRICAVPLERRGAQLIAVTDDPGDLTRVDALQALDRERELVLCVGVRDEILAFIDKSYGLRGDVGLILKELSSDEKTGAVEETADDEVRGTESDSAVIKLVNQIIIDGYRRGASDIHIEPNGREAPARVRFRIDGDCVTYQEVPAAFRAAVVARIKILAKLDISERRKPQDGKIRFRMSDRQIELRVATLPTVNENEDVVMRILAAQKPLPLEEMGMSDRNLRALQTVVKKPYGLVLCVGPTGSGKTTTLHSVLGSINTPDMKIWTAEDPVEITQPGLRQVQVQPKIGFDFATAMRAFLRADPDVIMVGEMRDRETASIAVEASLTGHLVLSTLHTNSAPETITRLVDMGLDPFSFADALLGVLAQRLARALCPRCKEIYVASEDEVAIVAEAVGTEAAMAILDPMQPLQLYRGRGCEACGGTGYKGRVALHELLVNDERIKAAVARRAPVDEIRQLSVAGGMKTLLVDGIEKSIAGRTDLKQVLAVCSR